MARPVLTAFLIAGAAILCDTVAAGETYKVWARDAEAGEQAPWKPSATKVYVTDESYPITPKDTLMGTAFYDDIQNSKGWDVFSYTADAEAMKTYPYLSWYAAGFAEGYATYKRIDQVYSATIARMPPLSDDTTKFLKEHLNFMNNTLNPSKTSNNNIFDVTLQKLLLQVKGLADGYTHHRTTAGGAKSRIGFWEMFLINLDNELPDFISAVNYHNNRSVARDTERLRGAHCSGLIKWTGDELYVSQVTWAGYEIFIGRQYKTYNMQTTNISMTTNAGHIVSGDDYFITSNNMSIIETTNDFYSNDLYQYITAETVSEFLRVMIANYVATSGQQWTALFATHNSGTYNNQWMVVDYKEFHPVENGNASDVLSDNVLWVSEQIPGMVVSRPETNLLRSQTYWPSYNIPADPVVFEKSGFAQMEAQFGSFFSYQNTSRAEIFRRDHSNVKDLKSMQKMMRYNDYTNDELSTIPNCSDCSPARSPYLAIASRGDLVEDLQGYIPTMYAMFFSRNPFGAVDAKITNRRLLTEYMVTDIVQGPTHDQQPVFSWGEFAEGSSMAKKGKLQGMPTNYDYKFKTWNENGPYTIPLPPFDSTQGKRIMAGVIGGCTAALLLSIFLVWYTQHRPMAKHIPLA